MTGPIAIEGAMPGDVLEVRIDKVALRCDWGYNVIRPLVGTLTDDFHETRHITIPLDARNNTGRLPWGLDLPLAPFFGVMGVAPPPAWGRISSIQPRAHGGNLDNKELIAGTTLYLPVFVPGALFSCGDGHGAQGDGEVCVTGIEAPMSVTARFDVRSDMAIEQPRFETAGPFTPSGHDEPTYGTTGIDSDLMTATKKAVRHMIDHLHVDRGLSRAEAYILCSAAVDLKINEVVDEPNWVVSAYVAQSLFPE